MKEILIDVKPDGSTCILLCHHGKLVEYYEENEEKQRLEGNIYLGKVQNILPGMQAAFIDIGEEKNAFIHQKDILPKTDITLASNPNNLCPEQRIETYIKQGQTVLVQIKRDATMRKGPRVSAHINLGNRFIALLPNTPFITVSQKIEDIEERNRLKLPG